MNDDVCVTRVLVSTSLVLRCVSREYWLWDLISDYSTLKPHLRWLHSLFVFYSQLLLFLRAVSELMCGRWPVWPRLIVYSDGGASNWLHSLFLFYSQLFFWRAVSVLMHGRWPVWPRLIVYSGGGVLSWFSHAVFSLDYFFRMYRSENRGKTRSTNSVPGNSLFNVMRQETCERLWRKGGQSIYLYSLSLLLKNSLPLHANIPSHLNQLCWHPLPRPTSTHLQPLPFAASSYSYKRQTARMISYQADESEASYAAR